MDILDKIKQFINDSIQSLFVRQKEDLSLVIHREKVALASELKSFISQQAQTNERDMANMQQNVFSLNQELQRLMNKLELIQEAINLLKEQKREVTNLEKMEPMPPQPKFAVLYAKMVDSASPLGFKIDSLRDKSEGCAFKITITDGLEGCYEIIDDVEIQQEMLAAFNPLISDSSIYEFVPQNPTQVTVIQPGTVIKEDNIFRIVNKQKIKII